MQIIHSATLEHLLRTRAEEDIASGRLGGIAISVCQNGKTVFRDGFGTTVPGGGVPVTDKTIYRMASMTKPVTALMAAMLIEEGKLSPDDRIEDYLPAYAKLRLGKVDENGQLQDGGEVQTKPTVWHLLTHSSGIGCGAVYEALRSGLPYEAKQSLDGCVSYFASLPLSFEPGTAQAYSGLAGFDILGRILEMVSGSDLETLLRTRIFEPCGMVDTTFEPSDAQWSRMIAMHDYQRGVATASPTVPGCIFENIAATHHFGGGGLISTLDDYVRFAEMLLNGGLCEDRRVASAAAIARMSTPQLSAAVQPGYKRWGYGVRVIVGTGYRVLPVGAWGWSGAYGTHFWVDPVNRVTAVYLKNSRFDGGSGAKTSYHFEEDVHASMQ